MRFELRSERLPQALLEVDASTGAVVSFVGRVRNLNEGRRVFSLEYEAFDDLALLEGQSILAKALDLYPIQDAACVHRVGHLLLEDEAIRVEVAAGHRAEAFEACRWIVDEIKARVPIWKKEHYEDGSSEWLLSGA